MVRTPPPVGKNRQPSRGSLTAKGSTNNRQMRVRPPPAASPWRPTRHQHPPRRWHQQLLTPRRQRPHQTPEPPAARLQKHHTPPPFAWHTAHGRSASPSRFLLLFRPRPCALAVRVHAAPGAPPCPQVWGDMVPNAGGLKTEITGSRPAARLLVKSRGTRLGSVTGSTRPPRLSEGSTPSRAIPTL